MDVLERDGYRCVHCGVRPLPLEIHHITKRSHGGRDELSNLVTLCAFCHQRTDWPYSAGRLVVTAENGTFTTRVVKKLSKWHQELPLPEKT